MQSSAIAALAMVGLLSPAQQFHRERGKAPPGKRWVNSSAYIPGGPHATVRGTYVKKRKTAVQMNAMHDKWFAARFEAKPASPT
jgi:hypothetical protein